MARYVHNDRLRDALDGQAFAALNASPGARACYDAQRAAGSATAPPSASSPTGSSASCTAASKTRTLYDEATAWPQHASQQIKTAA